MSEIATMNVKEQFLSTFGVQDFHFDTEASKAARNEATKRIEGLEFPTSKTEYWKYTRINRIVKAEYKIAESTTTIDITPFLIEGMEKKRNGFCKWILPS